MKKFSYLLVLFLSTSTLLLAQATFQKKILIQGQEVYANIKSSPDGKTAFIVVNESNSMTLIKIDEQGAVLWARQIPNYNRYIGFDFVSKNRILLNIGSPIQDSSFKSAILLFDLQGNLVWAKKTQAKSFALWYATGDNEDNVWAIGGGLNTDGSQKGFIAKFDAQGNLLKTKQIINGNKSNYSFENIVFDEKTAFYLVRFHYIDFSPDYLASFDKDFNLKYVTQLEDDLQILNWSKMSEQLVFNGIISRQNQANSFALGILNINDGKITKLKVLNDFPFISSNDNEIAVGYYRKKKISKLDSNLKPIWTKSSNECIEDITMYPSLTTTGDFYFTKLYDVTNSSVFGKMNNNGIVEDCPMKNDTPVEFRDTIFQATQTLSGFAFKDTIIQIVDANIAIKDVIINIKNHCPSPDASFEIPDTICQNAGIKPQNVKNTSDLHFWNTNTGTYNVATPTMTFAQNGTSFITHKTSIEGCSDTVRKSINVLSAPLLPRDTQVCNEKLLVLNFKNSNANAYFLENQSFTPPLIISKSGIYNLILKNLVCESEGKIEVDFVDVPPVSFPIDSIYCENELYKAQLTDFQNVVWDKNINADTLLIRDGSKHQYEASYFGCTVKGELQIPRKTCPLPEILFVPNIFSPNDDGINDIFQAFGNGFSIKRMDIYDRWGTLVYSSFSSNAAWDGVYKNQAANAAVYTYYIEYQDIKRNLLRTKKGDVMLVR